MELSARNQLEGRITALRLGTVMAKVEVEIGSGQVVATITRAPRRRLG